jgi:hypothetical protein
MGKITIEPVGVDFWDHVVFRGDNRKVYKTADCLIPDCGWDNLTNEEKLKLSRDLHTCNNDFDGEPDCPCKLEKFILKGIGPLQE